MALPKLGNGPVLRSIYLKSSVTNFTFVIVEIDRASMVVLLIYSPLRRRYLSSHCNIRCRYRAIRFPRLRIQYVDWSIGKQGHRDAPCDACLAVPVGGLMPMLSKFFCAAAVFTVSMPILAADVNTATLRDDRLAIQSRGDVQSVAAPDYTALHAVRLNRVLWEQSFERVSNNRGAALLAAPTQQVSRWGHLKEGYGTVAWPVFSNSITDIPGRIGIHRKPGIGACLLAALALVVLAVTRRRAGHHPIIPPRAVIDMQASPNGAR